MSQQFYFYKITYRHVEQKNACLHSRISHPCLFCNFENNHIDFHKSHSLQILKLVPDLTGIPSLLWGLCLHILPCFLSTVSTAWSHCPFIATISSYHSFFYFINLKKVIVTLSVNLKLISSLSVLTHLIFKPTIKD